MIIHIHSLYSLDIVRMSLYTVRMSLVIYIYILYSLDMVRRLVAGPKISHSRTSSTCHRAVPIEVNAITTLQIFTPGGVLCYNMLQCVVVLFQIVLLQIIILLHRDGSLQITHSIAACCSVSL